MNSYDKPDVWLGFPVNSPIKCGNCKLELNMELWRQHPSWVYSCSYPYIRTRVCKTCHDNMMRDGKTAQAAFNEVETAYRYVSEGIKKRFAGTATLRFFELTAKLFKRPDFVLSPIECPRSLMISIGSMAFKKTDGVFFEGITFESKHNSPSNEDTFIEPSAFIKLGGER
jgi:hypothetical protein